MAGRNDPRWSVRVSPPEYQRVNRVARSIDASDGALLRALADYALDVAPIGEIERRVRALSAPAEKVRGAAAPASSSRASAGAGAVSSPAPARRPLIDVVTDRFDGKRLLAARAITTGGVKVSGRVERSTTAQALDADVTIE